jgi:small subunit ribosomal protein S13
LARISGVDLPKKKTILYGLQYIYGIGPAISADILEKANVDPNLKVADLTEENVGSIRAVITAEYKVEGALRSEVQQNIKRLMDIGTYRGIRHRRGLPVRGQRTRTNARSRKGRKKTVAGKKKTPTKK